MDPETDIHLFTYRPTISEMHNPRHARRIRPSNVLYPALGAG